MNGFNSKLDTVEKNQISQKEIFRLNHGEAKNTHAHTHTQACKRHIGQMKTFNTYVIVILKAERDQDKENGQTRGIIN